MISLSAEALAWVEEKNTPVVIDIPYPVRGCCFDMTDCPAVGFGEPRQPEAYSRQTIDGVTVYVPHALSTEHPLVIRMRSFFGFRQLVLDGWRLV